MTSWLTQTLRFAWFCNVNGINTDALFSTLTGGDAENIQRNKVPSPQNPFLSVASGPFLGLAATVQVQPGRVDFLLQPPHPDDVSGLPLFELEPILPRAIERVASAVGSEHGLVRLAAFGTFSIPVDGPGEATEIAAKSAGFELPFADALDFQLQVNRRRRLQTAGYDLNRIVRYEVGAYQSFVMNISPASGQHYAISEEQHAASMAIDVNLVPNGNSLVAEQLPAIWGEMLQEFQAIFKAGGLNALRGET